MQAFRFFQIFISDRGNVATIWAFALLPIFAVVGLTLDSQVAMERQERAQHALDVAVLAGARMIQSTGTQTQSVSYTQEYFAAQIAGNNGLTCDTVAVSFPADEEIKADAHCYQDTSISSIMGRAQIEFDVSSTAIFGAGKLDVAFVFDISGSMNSSNRLTDLKLAASKAVTTLMPVTGSSSEGDVRVAMVAYNHMVDAGQYFEEVTGLQKTRTYTSNYTEDVEECKWVCSLSIGPICLLQVYQCNWIQKLFTSTKTITSSCVYERGGTHAFDDFQPTKRSYAQLLSTLPSGQKRAMTDASNTDGFLSTGYADFNRLTRTWSVYGTDCRSVKPFALNANAAAAQSYIQALSADGGTAGHQGIAWGWYMLSPKWSGVFTGTAAPLPYDQPDTKKAMILMTDGDFISQLYSDQGSSADQAKTLCDKIKAEGVVIYTVAFEAPQAGIDVMNYCASGPEYAFRALNGTELIMSYEAIALAISDLRIKA